MTTIERRLKKRSENERNMKVRTKKTMKTEERRRQ